MKINITKTFGQFAVVASCDANEAQVAKLIELGALYIFERQPSSAVEQKVFGPLLAWEQTERGTYKRPAKFERGSVDFTTELADKVKTTYEATKGKLGDGLELSFAVSSVVKHEGGKGEAEPTAEAKAHWTTIQALPEDQFNAWLAALKLDVDDYDDDSAIRALVPVIRAQKKKDAEERLAKMQSILPKIG